MLSAPSPRAIFATDLDGTLVDRADRVHPGDKEAVVAAREAGIVVTIATGRLTTRTLHIAEELGIDVPVICADGGVLISPATRALIDVTVLGEGLVASMLAACDDARVAAFVFDHGKIVGCARGELHHAYVRGWSHAIEVDPGIYEKAIALAETAVMFVAIGDGRAVERVSRDLQAREGDLDVLRYVVDGHHAVRYVNAGVDKGAALRKLATTLGVAAENTACVGDWLNDVPMFEAAGFSCAMPHAPSEVKAKATHVLDDREVARGPLGAALDAWARFEARKKNT
jgi:Cof subfamily protein (haloacid dehalogenase superfamily)